MNLLFPIGLVGGGRHLQESHPIHGDGGDHRVVGSLEAELHRVGVERFNRLDGREKGRRKGFSLGVEPAGDAQEVELHRLGVEVGPIVELHAFAQVKDQRLPVIFRFPRLGQLGDIVELLINGDQTIEEVSDHPLCLEAGGHVRIEAGDIRLPRNPEGPAKLGLLRPEPRGGCQKDSDEHHKLPDTPIADHHHFPPCARLMGMGFPSPRLRVSPLPAYLDAWDPGTRNPSPRGVRGKPRRWPGARVSSPKDLHACRLFGSREGAIQ